MYPKKYAVYIYMGTNNCQYMHISQYISIIPSYNFQLFVFAIFMGANKITLYHRWIPIKSPFYHHVSMHIPMSPL